MGREVKEAIFDRDMYILLRLPSFRFAHQNQFKKSHLHVERGKDCKKKNFRIRGTERYKDSRCLSIIQQKPKHSWRMD